MLGGVLLGCEPVIGYSEARYFWRKPGLDKTQAFKGVIYCMDFSDAAFQRSNGNQRPFYGPGLIGALTTVTIHVASTNAAMDQALVAYDQCMYDYGYTARNLSPDRYKALSKYRSNVEVAEVLSRIMAEPLNLSSNRVPVENTKAAAKANR